MYLAKRIGFYLITLYLAITLNFFLPRLMPGSAAAAVMARAQGRISPKALHALEVAFGLHVHESLIAQYFSYVGNTLTGHLGISLTYFPEPVSVVIRETLPWTLFLVGTATIIAFVVGTLLGIVVSWYRGRPIADSLPVTFTVMAAMPYFWVALLFLYVFGFLLGWFPLEHSIGSTVSPGLRLASIGSILYHSALPALSIVVTSMGGWILGMRNNMIGVLSEDYIKLAQIKGLPSRRVMLQYAARNALLPSLTSMGMSLGFVVGGAVLTEIVFSYPGIGYALYQAVTNQDYPLMQGIFLIIVLAVLLANFIIDLLYVRLDPRTGEQ